MFSFKPFSMKLKKKLPYLIFFVFQLSLCEHQLYVLFSKVVLVGTTVDRTFMIVYFIFVVTYKYRHIYLRRKEIIFHINF